ncbi:MAG: glycosyltransferase family 4 protein, partial [Pyrinomonadaceae bacterium]
HTALPDVSTVRYVFWRIKFRLLNRLSGFHLLTSNRNTLESLRGFLSESSLRGIPVAYSGIDGDEIRQALESRSDQVTLRQRFGLPATAFLVFALGQFIERKGCVTLLEAAATLREERPDLFYIWVGTDQLSADGQHQIESSGVADRFRYVSGSELGADRQALLSLLRLADLFVLPSLKEGLPLALLEAMALGKACIASNINAIPEALHDGTNGRLVPPGDAGALAEEISELASNDALRDRFAANGQQTVTEQFDERITAETTLAYYETCWDDRG